MSGLKREGEAAEPLLSRQRDGVAACSTGDAGSRSALGKALLVLDAVLAEEYAIGVPDLAERLGLPRQTAHRVVRQLTELGLLRREIARDRYTVGPRLSRLAHETLRRSYQRGPARAILEELVTEIGESCNLGMLDGHQVIYVERVECNWPLRVQLEAGSRVPLHCTAIGKLLLAHMAKDIRRRLLHAAGMPRYTDKTLTSEEELESVLPGIRKRGYATNEGEYAVGLIAVAVPLKSSAGDVVGGLALHAPEARTSLTRALDGIPQLVAAADKLTRLM